MILLDNYTLQLKNIYIRMKFVQIENFILFPMSGQITKNQMANYSGK